MSAASRPTTRSTPDDKRTRPLHWSEVLADQDDTISRSQALLGGMTPEAWEWRLERGVWTRLLPGVAVAHSGEPTQRQQFFGVVLHGGKDTALSGDAGLVAAGFKKLTLTSLDLFVPIERRVVGGKVAGGLLLVPHRGTVKQEWRRCLRGLDMLKPQAAVLHAAAWAPSDRAAEWRIAASVQQKLTAVPVLRKVLADLPRLRRRALILEVLDDVELGAHAASELEFLRFCRRNKLPLPDELQVRVRAGGIRYLDGRWKKEKVSLELDGAYHMEVQSWDADTLRGLQLAVAARGTGEQQVRLTRANLRHDEAKVAELLRTLVC